VRGRKGQNLRNEAKIWAAKLGGNWAENTDASVLFDGFLYREGGVTAVKLKKLRYGLDIDCIIEDKLPDDVADLRSLPLPQWVSRELWVRTQNERVYRRFVILPGTTAEIEVNTAENYRNTRFREAYWKNAPYRLDIHFEREGDAEG
jgi:hypothetical protein